MRRFATFVGLENDTNSSPVPTREYHISEFNKIINKGDQVNKSIKIPDSSVTKLIQIIYNDNYTIPFKISHIMTEAFNIIGWYISPEIRENMSIYFDAASIGMRTVLKEDMITDKYDAIVDIINTLAINVDNHLSEVEFPKFIEDFNKGIDNEFELNLKFKKDVEQIINNEDSLEAKILKIEELRDSYIIELNKLKRR